MIREIIAANDAFDDAMKIIMKKLCELEGIDVTGKDVPEIMGIVEDNGKRIRVIFEDEAKHKLEALVHLHDMETMLQIGRVTLDIGDDSITVQGSLLEKESVAKMNAHFQEWRKERETV